MIKEKKRIRTDKKGELIKELLGYFRTAAITFFVGVVITALLSFHARSEMIKNLYENTEEKSIIEKQIAQQVVSRTDFIKSLTGKNYAICMRVGKLYETAGDFQKAEYSYHLALQKVRDRVYTPYYRLIIVYIAQNKINDAENLLTSIPDISKVELIRFKTRSYIVLGDKYYSEGKFLSAAQKYEQAYYYYSRLKKQDKVVNRAIQKRLVNAYIEAAGVIVKNGYNSDAVRFLNKALKYEPDNYDIQYKLGIIYADLDPIKAINYFEPLLNKIPQKIDYNVYSRALMKAANIEDIQGNGIKAKYYRYKVHSIELFVNQKVIYKDDIDVFLEQFESKKILFRYKLKAKYRFKNNSAYDIFKMSAEFVLRQGDKVKETVTVDCANKKKPFLSNGGEVKDISVKFGKNIFTKRELQKYYVDIYLYKDPKFRTLVGTYRIPEKNIY